MINSEERKEALRAIPLLLTLVPVIFLLTSFTYIHHVGLYFPGGVDPEYNYLFNGITLAHFKFHLNAVGHPGTHIQCLIAIVARVVHLFRQGSLWDDVMLNPELYIKSTVYTANFINAVALFLLGIFASRYTGSIINAIGLQLTPYAFLMTIEVSCRLMPELIMVSIISAWIVLILKLLYENPDKRNYKKYSVFFAILFGFSLADKLTFLPFFVLPLFILPAWKYRIRYALIAIVAFFLWAFPVWFNFNKFTSWVTDLFLHKGVYGSGDKGIIDWTIFISNIKIILKSSRQLWISVILTAIMALIYMRKTKDLLVKITFGLLLVIIIHYVITAKHYAFYYLTPSLHLTIFILFLLFAMLKGYLTTQTKRKVPDTLFVITVLVLVLNTVPKINRQLAGLLDGKRLKYQAVEKFQPYLASDQPKIISAYYYGCSSLEYGLLFGLLESGRYGTEITAKYLNNYPSTVIYLPWLDRFYQGVYQLDPVEFIKPDVDYTLFVADHSDDMMQRLLTLLKDTTGYEVNLQLLEKFDPKAEAVYDLRLTVNQP